MLALSVGLGPVVLADNHGEDPEVPPATLADRLATFDELDWTVFAGEDWRQLHLNHSDNVIVHWPDGHRTTGLDVHIKELSDMFAFAPDMHLVGYPIRFGWSNWTATIAVMQGTFTEPLPTREGRSIVPTGKKFVLTMSTFGYWDDTGVMIEEWLFWDALSLLRQIGVE